jgi:hypothetical protein
MTDTRSCVLPVPGRSGAAVSATELDHLLWQAEAEGAPISPPPDPGMELAVEDADEIQTFNVTPEPRRVCGGWPERAFWMGPDLAGPG